MRRSLLQLLALLLLLYGGLCLAAFLFQSRLVYFPGGPPAITPDALGLAYEDVDLETADGVRIAGWWLPANEPRGALVLCHGNAGNVGDRLLLARSFVDMGLSVLLFDYRGYGRSDGRPGEEGTYLDAVAAHDHVTRVRGVAPARVAVYGESLGGAVGIELARRREVGALVVESAFTSLTDVGRLHYPWLPVRWLGRIRYASEAKLASLTVPLLVIHSPADELVPFAHALRLAAARPGAELLETAGAHNDGGHLLRAEWRARVERFVTESLGA